MIGRRPMPISTSSSKAGTTSSAELSTIMLDVRGTCKPCALHHSVHSSGCSALEIMRLVFSSSADRGRCAGAGNRR
jgi:hypothetical protein